MNPSMLAIIQKDLRSILANKRMALPLLLVPLIMTVVMPLVFLLGFTLAPDDTKDIEQLLQLLPASAVSGDIKRTLVGLLLNNILPVFFLIIPIMASSIMAAGSFVGEKEKRTLETLLYSPLSLRQIFISKVLAAFSLSMVVSLLSFAAMLLVLEISIALTTGAAMLPGVQWLAVMLLVSPAVSLIAITLIVRVSAKSQSVEDAQQGSVFLILPLILLIVGQFAGVLLINAWILLGIGAVCALLGLLLLRKAMGRFGYEALLK